MALKIPKVIGHRGAAAYAPENTLESILTAADLGIKWVELDVKLTKDQVPIIFHDEELERITGAPGLIAETNYEDLRDLDAGSWFGDSFSGIIIPTLEEAVEVLLAHNMGLNLEIKPCPGREKETAEVALDILSKIWDDHDKVLISSFQHVSLEAARDIANDWARGFLIGGDTLPENWKELADYLDVKTINIGSRLINPDLVADIHDLDLKCLVYTVNDPEEARMYQDWGVDAVFSDAPDTIEEGLYSVH